MKKTIFEHVGDNRFRLSENPASGMDNSAQDLHLSPAVYKTKEAQIGKKILSLLGTIVNDPKSSELVHGTPLQKVLVDISTLAKELVEMER